MSSRLPLSERLDKAIRQPQELIACSKVDGKVCFDDSALKYYYFPDAELNRKLNLGVGYEKYVPKPETDGHLDLVLECLEHYEKEHGRADALIVCWRGILTQIMHLVFDDRNEIQLHVQNFDDQIFMEIDAEADQKRKQADKGNQALEKFMYSGYNFENFATLDKPWGQCTREEIEGRYTRTPVHDTEYCTVVRSGVGAIKMIYGAEVDCILGNKSSNPLNDYVELKTSSTITNSRQMVNFERKLSRSWIQAFLVGTKKIVYGFRDQNLNLEAVEEFETDKIPNMVKSSKYSLPQQKWHGKEAIKFLAVVIAWLKDSTKPNQTYVLKHESKSPYLELVPKELNFEGRLGFLPAEFVKWRVSQMEGVQDS